MLTGINNIIQAFYTLKNGLKTNKRSDIITLISPLLTLQKTQKGALGLNKDFGDFSGEEYDKKFKERIKKHVTKGCENILKDDKECLKFQEKFIKAFEENDIDTCYGILLKTQIAAGITCYRLAAKEIYGLISNTSL